MRIADVTTKLETLPHWSKLCPGSAVEAPGKARTDVVSCPLLLQEHLDGDDINKAIFFT